MITSLLSVLIFIALALAVIGAVRRARLWRQGQANPVDIIGGLLKMPRRYLVDLHHVVARDKAMSNTHVVTAGGFVASAVLIVLVHLFELDSRILAWALLLTTATMFTGAIFVYRRRIDPPSRLSKGPWMRLPKSLLVFAASFFVLTLPAAGILPEGTGGWLLAVVLTAGIVWGMGEMFFGMTWGGPMKHAFAGALHLAFHRRAERFEDGVGRSTGLKAIDLTIGLRVEPEIEHEGLDTAVHGESGYSLTGSSQAHEE